MDALIAVPDLSAFYAAGNIPTLIDVRWSPSGPTSLDRYRSGHLPGAAQVDLDADLAAPPGAGGRHPLPGAASFQATMRRIGLQRDHPVVVYDQCDSTIAARLWWMLRYFGHTDVRVLDGGYKAWQKADLPIEVGNGKPEQSGDFIAIPGEMRLLTVSEVPALIECGMLLDARLAERFRGEIEPLDPVAGHIPGAVSVPTFANSDSDGLFLPANKLHERFAGLGITDDTETAVYCGSGVTAAHEVLALWLAGFEAALYVGSWSEWIADSTRPVSTT